MGKLMKLFIFGVSKSLFKSPFPQISSIHRRQSEGQKVERKKCGFALCDSANLNRSRRCLRSMRYVSYSKFERKRKTLTVTFRNSHPEPHIDSHINSESNPNSFTYSYTYSFTISYSYPNTNPGTHSLANSRDHSDADSYSVLNSLADPYAYTDFYSPFELDGVRKLGRLRSPL